MMRSLHHSFLFLLCFGLAACGSLTVNSTKCRSEGVFKNYRVSGSDTLLVDNPQMISIQKTVFISDEIVSLREVVEKNSMKCQSLKNVQLEIKEKFGLFNEIKLGF